MSIIEEALRKLADNSGPPQRGGAPVLRAHVPVPASHWLRRSGLLALVGVIVTGAHLVWPHMPGVAIRALAKGLETLAPGKAVSAVSTGPASAASVPAGPGRVASPAAAADPASVAPAVSAGAVASGLLETAVVPAVDLVPARPLVPSAAPEAVAFSGWHTPPWVGRDPPGLQAGNATDVVQTWGDRMDLAPKDHPLIAFPARWTRTSALALYRSLAGTYPTIMVAEYSQGKRAWRVLVAPEPSELVGVLAALSSTQPADSLGATTVGAWRTNRDAARAAPVALAPPVATPAAAPPAASLAAPPALATPPAPHPPAPVPKADASIVPPARAVSGLPVSATALPQAAATPLPLKAPAVADHRPDPTRLVEAFAVSSADAILRRFADVDRLLTQGKFDAALEESAKVEAEVGETWQTRYLSGKAAKGLQRWDEAVRSLTRANQLNPASSQVLLDRAICFQELGNHEAALTDLGRARAMAPNLPEVALNSGYSYDAQGRRDDAMREYRRFLELTSQREGYAKVRAWVARRVTL